MKFDSRESALSVASKLFVYLNNQFQISDGDISIYTERVKGLTDAIVNLSEIEVGSCMNPSSEWLEIDRELVEADDDSFNKYYDKLVNEFK